MSALRKRFVSVGLSVVALIGGPLDAAVAMQLQQPSGGATGGSAGLTGSEPAPFELHVPVVFYHHVKCAPDGTPPSDLYICPTLFEAHLTYLRDHGWQSITTDKLADLLATRTCPEPRRFVVSFDDGPIDQYTVAAPIMESLGMRGTFFVIARRTGNPIEMSYVQMRDLVARGHAFGSHTLTHADLRVADAEKLYLQIEGAQQVLARELGFRPRTFAYPYGRYSEEAIHALRDSGLELAFTIKRGARESTIEPLLSPRINGGWVTSGEELMSKLEPFVDGCPPPTADLAVALAPTGPFKGDNVFSPTPIRAQTARRSDVRVGTQYSYSVVLQNDSNESSSFSMSATLRGTASMAVSYSARGVDVTDQFAAATYVTPQIAPWATLPMVVRVTPHRPKILGTSTIVDIRAAPLGLPDRIDLVRVVTRF